MNVAGRAGTQGSRLVDLEKDSERRSGDKFAVCVARKACIRAAGISTRRQIVTTDATIATPRPIVPSTNNPRAGKYATQRINRLRSAINLSWLACQVARRARLMPATATGDQLPRGLRPTPPRAARHSPLHLHTVCVPNPATAVVARAIYSAVGRWPHTARAAAWASFLDDRPTDLLRPCDTPPSTA